MAGALGLALAGPRSYGGVTVEDAFMGEGGRREATPADIRRALALYRMADALLIVLLGVAVAVYAGSRYSFGSVNRMGPGFYPTVLGIGLAGLAGLRCTERGRRRSGSDRPA